MKYILDTNQIIDYFRGNPEAIEKLTPLFKDGIAISVITTAEYLSGAYQSTNPKKNTELFQDFLVTTRIVILPIDVKIATQYAKFQAEFERKGGRIPHFDLLIASTAIVHDLILVSSDKVFARISELKVI